MIQIELNKSKDLIFDLSLEGIERAQLSGMFRLTINEVEYGFKCELSDSNIKVTIPPMGKILKENIFGVFDAKLDITGSNVHLEPWHDTVEIKTQPKVITTLSSITESIQEPQIKASLSTITPKTVDEEEVKISKKKNSILRSKLT